MDARRGPRWLVVVVVRPIDTADHEALLSEGDPARVVTRLAPVRAPA